MTRALVVLCLLTGVAAAAPDAKIVKAAEKRFARGNALYEAGKYQEALLNYQAAYELVPSLDILFNVGLAKEKLLDYEGCAIDFEQVVAAGGDLAEKARPHASDCRARTKIPVTITSAPAGAALYDGDGDDARFLGRTPVTLDVTPGTFEFYLQLDGYVTQLQRVDAKLGTRPRYDFPLTKEATLRIESNVVGAMISIDDGPAEPAPFDQVITPGTYAVHVTAPGYEPSDRVAKVEPGADVQLSIDLQTLPTKQRLRVRSLAPAEILIDGAPPDDADLAAGIHVIEARARGRVPYRGQIVLPAGKDLEAVVELPRKRTRLQRGLLWGGAGAAAVFAIGGGIYGGLALDAEADYDAMPSRDTRDNGVAFRFAADLCLGTAVVVGAATAIYWWITRLDAARLEVVR